jgi:hypothetical protein
VLAIARVQDFLISPAGCSSLPLLAGIGKRNQADFISSNTAVKKMSEDKRSANNHFKSDFL